MTDTRVTQHHRGKLQPSEAFNLQGSRDPQKPGLPQEPGFLFGSCRSGRLIQAGADGRRSKRVAPDATSGVPVHKHWLARCACVPQHVLQTEPACSDSDEVVSPGSRADTAEMTSPR